MSATTGSIADRRGSFVGWEKQSLFPVRRTGKRGDETEKRKEKELEMIKIMPCLDMKDGRVVKGVHFADLQDAGDPVEAAALYRNEGADELAMLDIAATLEDRRTRLEWVKKVSAVIDIPLTVGGGISSLEDIEMLLAAGADSVSMNSAAVKRPKLVSEAAREFGTNRITVALDARRSEAMPSGFELVVSGGTRAVGKDAVEWARQCEAMGAGVILPTSMDGDGTRAGYDIAFIRAITAASPFGLRCCSPHRSFTIVC